MDPRRGTEAQVTDKSAVGPELIRRLAIDQHVRRNWPPAEDIAQAARHPTTVGNTRWLRGLVELIGWPTISEFGPRAENAAFVLVQHSDASRPFQAACLRLLAECARRGEAPPWQVAFLYDRIAMGAGRPQRFGTQYVNRGGILRLWDTEDPDRVDDRRARFSLPPLSVSELSLDDYLGGVRLLRPAAFPASTAPH